MKAPRGPGRPRKGAEKRAPVKVYLSPREAAILSDLADFAGLDRSAYIRTLLEREWATPG